MADIPFLVSPKLPVLSADPSSPSAGDAYVNSSSNKLRIYNGSTWDEYSTAGGIDVQTFTANGTWTKPSWAKRTRAIIFGGGGPGGSGRRGAAASVRYGGSGGSAGACVIFEIDTSLLGATESVTVGAGGTGGTVVTTDDTNGHIGLSPGSSSFAGVTASAGNNGFGGNSTGSVLGGSGVSNYYDHGNVVAGPSGAAGDGGGSSFPFPLAATGATFGAGSGGCGGGINASDVVSRGGGGGASTGFASSSLSGGANSAGAGNNGSDYTAAKTVLGGSGGSGGAATTSAAGNAGGNGGIPAGGGGGGSASVNGNNSGAGGNGGRGEVRIYSW